jgi:LPPG:FO 2-phospho-L-lactate transferase
LAVDPLPSRLSGGDIDVVVLAGGTGGAKLARGMLDVVVPERLTIIANTGDDIDIYGAHVSPDPDLISFWLADLIDERGWGLDGDTFAVMDALRDLGVEVWFNLGDRDLAWCLERVRLTDSSPSTSALGSLTPTYALALLNKAIGVRARVLPMSDEPVRTWIRSAGQWRGFQEFMIGERGQGPIEDLEFRGIEQASATPDVLAAIEHAEVIIVGPSNPLISIAPILAVPGVRDALNEARAPVVAVSPIVGGEILKGPTAAFMEFAGHELNARGIAEYYGDLLDGLVTDEAPSESAVLEPASLRPRDALAMLSIDVAMPDPQSRTRIAQQVLDFARSLAGGLGFL